LSLCDGSSVPDRPQLIDNQQQQIMQQQQKLQKMKQQDG
jgi:hypothetical protein